MKKVFVEIRPKVTRLGNWLFQYAAAKSAAPEGEVVFVIQDRNDWPAVEKYRELFPEVTITDEEPDDKSLLRTGLYQDVRVMDEGLVRELLRMPERVRARLRERSAGILNKELVVGVSVRRGDYLALPHRHPFVGKSYLKRAIRSFDAKAIYVVCSDDIPWCKANLPKMCPERQFVFIENEDVLTQLYIHTLCHHNICSNSSFSWWGAYLNGNKGKRVLVPSRWYGLALKNEDWSGLIYEGCELVENRYTLVMWIHAVLLMCKTRIGDLLRKGGLR